MKAKQRSSAIRPWATVAASVLAVLTAACGSRHVGGNTQPRPTPVHYVEAPAVDVTHLRPDDMGQAKLVDSQPGKARLVVAYGGCERFNHDGYLVNGTHLLVQVASHGPQPPGTACPMVSRTQGLQVSVPKNVKVTSVTVVQEGECANPALNQKGNEAVRAWNCGK